MIAGYARIADKRVDAVGDHGGHRVAVDRLRRHTCLVVALYLERFDDDMNVTATVVCDSALYLTRDKIWRLDGNVRMRWATAASFIVSCWA